MRISGLTAAFLALNLCACALHDVQHDDPPVAPAKPGPTEPMTVPEPEEYVVQRGDTLYAIAWEQGLDYQELAGWNHIASPYTIYPGQTIHLRAGAAPAPGPGAVTTAAPDATLPPEPAEAGPVSEPMPSPGRYQSQNRAVAVASKPGTTGPDAQIAEPAPGSEATPPPPPQPIPQPTSRSTPAAAEKTASGDPVWHWPTIGTVASTFASGDSSRQGIDIRGREGQSVLAAAAGEVVYSGNGLIGYGELIIIKHDDTWLSAYGNNSRRNVNEGVSVSAGQAIAEMGQGKGDHAELHFEIRRKGKPVDPLRYLPRR